MVDGGLEFDTQKVILGALLRRPHLVASTLDRLPPMEFTSPLSTVAEQVQSMADRAEPVTPETLLHQLNRAGQLQRIGGAGLVYDLVAAEANSAGFDYLVAAMSEAIDRRRMRAALTRTLQRLESPDSDLDVLRTEHIEQLQAQTVSTVETISDWPNPEVVIEPRWVVPGLLAADERVMITGGEGRGKSVLIRQLVASVVVGRHPFNGEVFAPGKALHVDLENPQHVSDAGYRMIYNRLVEQGVPIHRGLLDVQLPRVFNINNPRDVGWLMRKIRSHQPDLIAIGPVKNIGITDSNDDVATEKVQQVLNRIRGETGAALILEGHASHGSRETDWRPRGSSTWLGWPEIGFGLKPTSLTTVDLIPWRGARTPGRDWPEHLTWGVPFPWVEDPRKD